MMGLVLLSLCALLGSILALRFAWTKRLPLLLGLGLCAALLILAIISLVPAIGEGRATMSVLAILLPGAVVFLLLGRDLKAGRGQSIIKRETEKVAPRLHFARWIAAGPLAAAIAIIPSLGLGFLPGLAIETRVALVFCFWPVFWSAFSVMALSSDCLNQTPESG